METAGKVSIMDMIQHVTLELQMAKDRSPYKEQVAYLEGRLQFWEERRHALKRKAATPARLTLNSA